MKTHVEFRSEAFQRGSDDEVGGRVLARFVSDGLQQRGFEPGKPNEEDWGWVVPIKNDRCDLWIGCGEYEEYPDGYGCFIEPHKPVIRRFGFLWKVDVSAEIAALQRALDGVLTADARIRDVRWWTYDEFMRTR